MSEISGALHTVKTTGFKSIHRCWAREMAIGDVAVIDDDDALEWHQGHVIMRTYSGFVSLNSPRMTWSDKAPPYRVRPVSGTLTINLKEPNS